jgi:hypothetical protein
MAAPVTASDGTRSVRVCCESCGRPTAVEFRDYGNAAPRDFWTVMLGVHVSRCGFCHEQAVRAQRGTGRSELAQ